MALIARGAVPERIKKEDLEERRKELLNEMCDLTIKKVKNPPALSTIGIYLPKKEIIPAVHEELCLKQMYKNYMFFLEEKKKIYKIKEISHPDKKAERLCKLLKSKLEKYVSLFWKDKKQFDSAEDLMSGYFYNDYWILLNNPDFAKKYKGISLFQLKRKRKENKNFCDYLCSEMPKYSRD